MTSSGKVRIYELSKDLGLDNKDVLDAAEKLSIAAKSHSSSISESEAGKIRTMLKSGGASRPAAAPSKPAPGKSILSVKKADSVDATAPVKPEQPKQAPAPAAPTRAAASPQRPPARPAAPSKPGTPQAAAPQKTAQKPVAPPQTLVRKEPPQKQPPQKPVERQSQAPLQPTPRPAAAPGPNRTASRPASPPARPSAPSPSTAVTPRNTAPIRRSPSEGGARPTPPPPGRPQPKSPVNRTVAPPQRPAKPELVGRPQPKRPGTGAPPRPGAPRPGAPAGQRSGAPQRPAGAQRPGAPTRPGSPSGRPGAGRPASTLELVGKPIRRDSTSNRGEGARPGAGPRSGAGSNRPAMPPGMRKPVAPGELMQLQKPTGRPAAPPPRRPDGTPVSPRGDGPKATPPVNRPTPSPATAPRRPGFRPGAGPGGQRRPGRPDWDDSAKLEALRNRSPQKQRQKVHIIGENDDSLAAQTGGFAGEQENMVLSASLARPAKPKSQQRSTPKPVAAIRKRRKETARQRQRRRAMELRAAREAKQVRPEMIVVPEDNLTVQELADMLSVESSEIIKSLFFKGIIATVTQTLDMPTIETVAEEFGVPVIQDDVEEAAKKTVEMIEEADREYLIRRPPVVTVMGHVDHGKTSLLDAIRKARVAAGEAGGITQHIGAYQVEIEHNNAARKLTFLDTPGHEAFTAMRARGTKVTDVAVLVVAADDGVRPQTLEAISHARAAEVPIVVAINKIDKEGASPDRVKQELSEQNLLAEEWGGDVVMVPVSAIKGENIDKLLEMLLLVTEVEDLQANPDRMARGTVIEAHLDKAKGPVATLLVQNGTLRTGDVVAAGPVLGKVRAMVDYAGVRLKDAGPSFAVEALGFSEVPTAGDEFEVYADEKSARAVVGDRASDARATRLAQQMASRRVSLTAMSGQANEGELKELNLILKADVQGSVEAILGSLEQLPKDEVQVRVLLSAPGEVTETDVDLAAASGAVIIGFNTSMASGARKAADANSVDVRDYDVIYKLLEDIQLAMEGLLEPELVEESLGEAEVRAVFTIGKSAVAGCYVTTGKIQRNCKVRVHRGKEIVYAGDLDSLRRNKDDVKEVATGFECGVGTDRFANWQEGDRIEAFKMVTQRRKLTT
ncbi:translation initiation factor IF-2 [Synechococcus sp. BIOS-U3-1]|uniref:translation initiation factor IF-2 n=1 Tax=Synechococcus sp. BIOS-U3-1 TaxID=1400865 RepID=UPI001646FD98|nr:translation initiation factor IF-2 [Synechococcus sp. BIOS-U3-1]QNI59741.1 translation initiation factor IF-2 [Synechococcus sp. BIOS-U3-1]